MGTINIAHEDRVQALHLYALVFQIVDGVQGPILNHSTGEFEELDCPITEDHIIELDEDPCRDGYYSGSATCNESCLFVSVVYQFDDEDDDPYMVLPDIKLSASKITYFNGTTEITDQYLQIILDELRRIGLDVTQILSLINNGTGGGTTNLDDLIYKIYAIVQNIQSRVNSIVGR